MKLKLPKAISVLGKKIKVRLVDTKDYAGLWDYESFTIYLSINQTPEQLEETWHHELEHCIQWMTALNQAIPRELLETMAEMRSRLMPELIRKCYTK
jgi:hypothetical protein